MGVSFFALLMLAMFVVIFVASAATIVSWAPQIGLFALIGVCLLLVLVGFTSISFREETATIVVEAPPAEVVESPATVQLESVDRPVVIAENDSEELVEPESQSDPKPVSLEPLSIKVTEYHGSGSTFRHGVKKLPGWVRDESTIQQQDEFIDLFLTSQRFATVEEAREQLWMLMRHELQVYTGLQEESHDHFPMQMAFDLGLIDEEVDVTYPLELNGFEEQVHQVHWKAQIGPGDRAAVLAQWKPTVVHDRLVHLAMAMGGATMLMGGGAVFARRRRNQHSNVA